MICIIYIYVSGSRRIQLQGFFMMTLLFLLLGFFYQGLKDLKYLLVILYGNYPIKF